MTDTPSKTAMDAAKRISDLSFTEGMTDAQFEEILARIIDEAYAPLREVIDGGVCTNKPDCPYCLAIQRATPTKEESK